jgi:chemotaxis signal transduction protein
MNADAEALSVLPMRVAGEDCALPALAVEEILGTRRVVPIPGAPPHLPGVVAWRGRAVALLDLGVLLGKPRLVPDAPIERIVVIALADGSLALPAEWVEAVHIAAASSVHTARVTHHRFATVEVEVWRRVLPLLDLGLLSAALLGQSPSRPV